MKTTIIALLLPILGAIAAELVRILGTKAKENLNPAIAVLKPYFSVIDAAMDAAPAELRDRIKANPVAAIATELLAEQGEGLTTDQIASAVSWASKQFNFTIHEQFDQSNLSPTQKLLAGRLVSRLGDRLLG